MVEEGKNTVFPQKAILDRSIIRANVMALADGSRRAAGQTVCIAYVGLVYMHAENDEVYKYP
jgi:hypothetical protein